jgi:hypothetical protein
MRIGRRVVNILIRDQDIEKEIGVNRRVIDPAHRL